MFQHQCEEKEEKCKSKMFQCHVSSPPQVCSDNHHTWAEFCGEEDAREASGKEAHAESCGEGGSLEEDSELQNVIFLHRTNLLKKRA